MAMCYQKLKKLAKNLETQSFQKLSDQILTGQQSESRGYGNNIYPQSKQWRSFRKKKIDKYCSRVYLGQNIMNWNVTQRLISTVLPYCLLHLFDNRYWIKDPSKAPSAFSSFQPGLSLSTVESARRLRSGDVTALGF